MPGITFDETRWPIVTIHFLEEVEDHEYRKYLETYSRLLNRARLKKGRIVCIMDASASPHTPKHQQKLQSQWLKENKELIGSVSAGAAFVITSPLQRFILSGIFLLAPVPTVYKVFATMEEAEAWSHTRLKESEIKSRSA